MQQITATCPRCQTSYQVDAALRGKRMRCLNTICRTVFEVGSPAPSTSPVAAPTVPVAAPVVPAGPVSGSVADFVTVLPAEIALPEAAPVVVAKPVTEKTPPPVRPTLPPRPVEPPAVSWRLAPPPVRAAQTVVAAPILMPGDPTDDFPDDASANPSADPSANDPAPAALPTLARPVGATRRQRALSILVALLLVLAGGGVAVLWQVQARIAGNETERFAQAQQLYDDQNYEAASTAFQKLHQDYPKNAARYQFLGELSDVRRAAEANVDSSEDTDLALRRVLEFLTVNRNDARLKDHHPDVWQMLHHLAGKLAQQAEQDHAPATLKLARRAWSEAKKFEPPARVNAADAGRQLEQTFARAEKSLAEFEQRAALVRSLHEAVEQPTAPGVFKARALVKATGLNGDTEIAGLLDDMVQAHRASVRYVPASTAPAPAFEDDTLPSLVVAPALGKVQGTVPGGVVLALANGVLYAQEPTDGAVRWARRVGVDTQLMPLRVPADTITPELALVLSARSQSGPARVAAIVVATGAILWQQTLAGTCEGPPVLVERSLLVPTRAGQVEEIEISQGRRLGVYELGQPLTVGGVQLPGTALVVFPAEELCVYVLDVTRRTGAGLLYTGHAAGTLRGLPAFVADEAPAVAGDTPPAGRGWMLLTLAEGSDRIEIRPYAWPIQEPDQKPAESVRTTGRTWFGPWHDADKLAVATDVGQLMLWGLRQPGNRPDPLLFPLLKDELRVDLGKEPGKALLAHADAANLWMLAHGRLHRLQMTFADATGPALAPRWPQPPTLGSPLVPAEARNGSAASALLLTTALTERPVHLSSAVDAASGQLLWQRQLGCVPLRPLAALGAQLVLRDPGGLLRFDPAQLPDPAPAWRAAGEPLDQRSAPTGVFDLLTRDQEIVEIAWPGFATTATAVQLRRIPLKGERAERTVPLPAAPHGTAHLGAGFVLLPLANGDAARVPLADGATTFVPNWRGKGVEEQQPGHIVALTGDDYLLTDGSRGLKRLHWTDKDSHTRGNVQLAQRITHAPVVVPGPGEPRIAVADLSDTVTLLDASLNVVRHWKLPGKLTAGPFVRAGKIGGIVGKTRLVWLDPDRDAPLWERNVFAEIVGPPALVDAAVIVATLAGQFLALDATTGQLQGTGYTTHADVAPAAAPLAFGPGRLFAPLTDGTILLLPLAKLRTAEAPR